MRPINDPAVVEEVTALHLEYEAALVSNDIAVLDRLFWRSDHVVRFGATEALYGTAEVSAFRLARSAVDLARTTTSPKVVSFGWEMAISTVEFERPVNQVVTHGRQTQVWRRFDEGWKIVSAHVSYVRTATDAAAELAGLTIPPQHRRGVQANLTRIRELAQTLFDFPLGDTVEAAPVFRP